MKLLKAQQILKTFADKTRLRIVNLLNQEDLAVNEICGVLEQTQPNISKHLLRLRLTGIVRDKRIGPNSSYYLVKPEGKAYKELLHAVVYGLEDVETFKNDLERLKNIRKINQKGGENK
ncbi:MAG: metalloregulator ArsR/SmtB family transcription factor [Spirochaetes bacterium]|nr:metalloregulator ArsR/SmtB family transcription factor [Spirochaetota bacterium]